MTSSLRQQDGFKVIYYCPIEVIKGFTDKKQFQYLTKLKGPQEGTYLYTTQFLSLRYLDGILNINNVYFDNMVRQIYPSELQYNKANTSDTKAAFLDLHLSISNDIVFTKIYDKRDNFDFQIVNFPFLDGDVPRSTS